MARGITRKQLWEAWKNEDLDGLLEAARCVAEAKKPNAVHRLSDIVDLFWADLHAAEAEEFHVLCLDTRNGLVARERLYLGTINTSMVRVAEVFRTAIRENAVGIVVVHNHPSGDPTPSPEDVAITRAIVEAGRLLDITVLDHVIIGRMTWKSLREMGLGF